MKLEHLNFGDVTLTYSLVTKGSVAEEYAFAKAVLHKGPLCVTITGAPPELYEALKSMKQVNLTFEDDK